jgi:predicted Zn-dependent protease
LLDRRETAAELRSQTVRLYGDSVASERIQAGIGVWVAILMLAPVTAVAGAQSDSADRVSSLIQQGFQLHSQARFAEAIPLLERARQLEPDNYFANLLLGIDLLRTGKPAQAVTRLELSARIKPGEEFPEDYLGEAEAALGHNAQAAEAYQRAVERGHGSEQALEAWAGFALERFKQLGEELRASQAGVAAARRLAVPAEKPACTGSIPALEQRLTLAEPAKLGQPAKAAQRVPAVYQLSQCYAAAAGSVAARLQSAKEDMAAVYRLRGDVLLRLKGDAAGAEAEYQQALAARPGDPALLERLAEAQLTAGDNDGARASAQAALDVDPHRREALRTLASISMNNRDYTQALPWLRQLAHEAPGDRGVQVELAKALVQTGAEAEAVSLLAPALAAGYPDEKGALHALLSRALRHLGRTGEADRADAEARRLSDAFQAQQSAGSPDANH